MINKIPIKKFEQIFFDDVEVGSEIPPLTKGPYTKERNVMFASVHGDWAAGHYDYKEAKRYAHNDIPIAYGQQIVVNTSQLLTDWIGPKGTLKKFTCRVRDVTYDGESLTMGGKVTKKYVRDGEGFLECEVWGKKQQGGTVASEGWALVALPLKGRNTAAHLSHKP